MKTTNQFLQITIYYCTFIVITLGILVILPNTYNALAIYAIKSYFKNTSGEGEESRSKENIDKLTIIGLNTLEFCVRVFFILFIVGCFIFGFLYNGVDVSTESTISIGVDVIDNLKINTIVFGLYFFIVLITCSLVIFNAKDGLLKQNDIAKESSISEDFVKVINNITTQFMNMYSKENWICGYTSALLGLGVIIFLIVDYNTFIGYFDKAILLLTISVIFGIFIILYYLIFLLLGNA
jgi:hypothetical protein